MSSQQRKWTFFTNHAHVFLLIARRNDILMREIAQEVGITERAVQGIIDDLAEEGYVMKEKVGRTNVYRPIGAKHLRHPLESDIRLEDIIRLLSHSILGANENAR